GQGLDVAAAVDGEAVRVVDQVADQVEVGPAVLGLALDGYGDQVGRVQKTDGVAVGLGARHFGKTDGASRAGPVQHHDLGAVAQVLFNERSQGARDQVGAAARAIRHHHVDRVLGVLGLR